MKGKDFYNDIKTLLNKQRQQESSIDFNQLLEVAGGQNAIERSQSGSRLSEFFVDPTLFSLLREYTESGDDNKSPIRRPPTLQQQQQDGPAMTKKPQARDVLPKRVLDEEGDSSDELESRDSAQHEPKYRAIATYNTSNNNNNNLNEPFTSSSRARSRVIVSTSTNDTSAASSSDQANDVSYERTHPDIPATSISKKFMDMASLLERSPLRTIKKSHLMVIPPRIKQRLNYADSWDTNMSGSKANKVKGRKSTTSEQHDLTSSTTMTPSSSSSSLSSSVAAVPTAPLLPILNTTGTTASHTNNNNSNREGELIYTFSIYQALSPSKKLQEFHVLGSQTLVDLRDALYCRMDFTSHGDRMDNQPDGEVINTFRQKRSASYFFIDKTFYVDQRLPSCKDISAPIRDWLQQQQQQYSTVVPMDALALRDLPLQLNTPYLFDHQQHCQHVVMIRDIRLLESRDKRQADQYPVVTYSWRYRRYKCNMCMIYPAVYVTTNDYLSGFSPCFFCERCYEPFHFDKEGNAVTSFDTSAYHGT